jgi:hypothetical protein
LTCWFCNERFQLGEVQNLGILRSRSEAQGGPYRLYLCPVCQRHNLCEKTPRGRWFSSPTFRPNLLEYLFGRLLAANPQEFLQAVSWYRDNEERRRYFFQRDGDRRYSGGGLLWKLWPTAAEGRASSGSRPRPRESRRSSAERPATPRAGIVTPWEILGVPQDASEPDIRRAFQRLAVQYHPDKVHHRGDEFRKLAHRKFTELQRAYDELLSRRERHRS